MAKSGAFELREVAAILTAVTLGDDMRTARERLQMTQDQVAEAVGVSVSTISNWERDRAKPKSRLARVRQVLQMDERDERPSPLSNEEQVLREASDQAFWAEATRRFFDRRGKSTEVSNAPHTLSGRRAPMPTHLLPPQSGERRNSDG